MESVNDFFDKQKCYISEAKTKSRLSLIQRWSKNYVKKVKKSKEFSDIDKKNAMRKLNSLQENIKIKSRLL